jgi:hypothetical protein
MLCGKSTNISRRLVFPSDYLRMAFWGIISHAIALCRPRSFQMAKPAHGRPSDALLEGLRVKADYMHVHVCKQTY